MVLAVTVAIAAAWAAVLLHSGPSPLWLLVVLVLVLAVGGPASMIAFDFARTFNPSHRIGTATGIVNVGGFFAALVTMYMIGLIIDVLNGVGFSPDGLYSLDAFRVAFSFQFLVLGIGIAAVITTRRKVRRTMAERGELVPPLRDVLSDNRRRRQQFRKEQKDERTARRD